MLLVNSTVSAQELPEWAEESSRTQGGGWVWFPGKGENESKSEAVIQAENAAVDYMIKECSVPHKDTKFHERFERKNGKVWEVYVRASVKDQDCQYARNTKDKSKVVNYPLLSQYLSRTDTVKIDSFICRRYDTVGCLEVADGAWRSGRIAKALAYAKRGCELGNSYTCGFYGYLLWETKNLEEARTYFTMACNEGQQMYCNDVATMDKLLASK